MTDRALATVHVIDDDPVIRESTTFLLESAGLRVRTYAACADYLTTTPSAGAGCILLDLRLPGMTGLELQRELVARGSHLPIIFITAHGDTETAVLAMKGGAVEFLEKPYSPKRLLDAVEAAVARDGHSLEWRADRARAVQAVDRLSQREREVLADVVRGERSQDIADRLDISRRTVESHRNNIMKKLRARNVAELVRLATIASSSPNDHEPAHASE